jgi:hypothetical protein
VRLIEVFDAVDLEVIIQINHRLILDGLFIIAGTPK